MFGWTVRDGDMHFSVCKEINQDLMMFFPTSFKDLFYLWVFSLEGTAAAGESPAESFGCSVERRVGLLRGSVFLCF